MMEKLLKLKKYMKDWKVITAFVAVVALVGGIAIYVSANSNIKFVFEMAGSEGKNYIVFDTNQNEKNIEILDFTGNDDGIKAINPNPTYEDYIDAIDEQIEKEAGIKYDKNTDYSALMMGYLAAGGSKDDDQFKELQKQREAKIDGEGYTKEKYGTRGSEFINNIEKNNTWYKDKDAVNKKLKELGIQTFATGGYTGDWGPEGKLAILHEKELILNTEDTANLLSTISFIRDLVSLIDSQATSASLYNLMSTPGVTTSQEVLEQKVEIHAEFPNATDHNEIEEAFNNLVNRASQYANRK